MATCKEIIRNIQSKRFSSLNSDIESILTGVIPFPCNFLCDIIRAICNCLISLDKCSKEICILLESSVTLCIDFLQKHYKAEEFRNFQFDRSLFFIIQNCLKFDRHKSALLFAKNLKTYFDNLSNENAADEKFSVIANNVYIIFWNAAIDFENCNKSIDRYDLGFKLRMQALDYFLMDKLYGEKLCDKVCIILHRYWKDNPRADIFKCTTFFKKSWDQLLRMDTYSSNLLIFFKLFHSFNSFLLKYGKKHEHFIEMLACLDDLLDKSELSADKNKAMQVIVEILKCCIKTFTLTIYMKISRKTLKDLEKFAFKVASTTEDLVLRYTLDLFYLHFVDIVKSLNMNADINRKVFLKSSVANLDVWEFLAKEYLKLPLDEESNKNFPCLSINKLVLSNAFIRFYICILEEESVVSDKKKHLELLKKADAFVEQSLVSINYKSFEVNSEEKKAFVNYGKIVGKLANLSYKSENYEESAKLLEVSIIACSPSATSSLGMEDHEYTRILWIKQELMIYSYLLSNNHKEALVGVVRALCLNENKVKECMELWIKIKRNVLRDKSTTMISKTIADVILESECYFAMERIQLLLLEELKHCKMERCNMNDEMIAVVNKLLSISTTGVARAQVLVELVSTPFFSKGDNPLLSIKSSSIEICQEAIQLYKNHLSMHPNDNKIKLHLSVAYFWFHHITLRNMHEVIMAEMRKVAKPPTTPNPKEAPINDYDDENDTCDIQPGTQFVTLFVETKTLENLDFAYQLWTEISQDNKCSWTDLADVVNDVGILEIIQASCQIFSTAVHDLKEWKISILLFEVAIAIGSKLHELSACSSIIRFAVRLGYLKLARYFVNHGLTLMEMNSHKYEVLRFHLARSCYFFHIEKFDEGLKVLDTVLSDPFLNSQKTKHLKLLQTEISLVLSKYLALPEAAFQNIECYRKLSSSETTLNCALDSAKICQTLLKYESSEENRSSDVLRNDSILYKSKLVHTLLASHLLVGKLYMQIGAPREARYFLQEALAVAQPLILTYWCCKILTILGQHDLLCNSPKDCLVKINGLQYIMNNKLRETIATVLSRHYESVEVSDSSSFSEDSFIVSKMEQNIKGQMRQKFLEKYSEVFSSPVASRKKSHVSEHNLHPSFVEYDKCGLFSLQFMRFEIYLLKNLHMIAEGSIEDAAPDLEKVLQEYSMLSESTTLSNEISQTKFDVHKFSDQTLHRTSQEMDAEIITYTSLQLSIIHSYYGRFDKATSHISHALNFLQTISECPKYLYLNLHAVISYHKIITSMKKLIGAKGHIKIEYQIFPTARTGVTMPRTSCSGLQKTTAPQTPQNRPIPKICISDYSRASNQLCKAPVKKDVLPTHVKKSLASVADTSSQHNSSPFQPLFFSSDDNDSPFADSAEVDCKSKKQSKKITKAGDGDGKIEFKFFKSKSASANINCAGDIWGLPISSALSAAGSVTPQKNRSTRSSARKIGCRIKKEVSCDSITLLTNAPSKKSHNTRKLSKHKSVEILDDYVSVKKNQFRESREITKSSSSLERARSTSRDNRGNHSHNSSEEEINHIEIDDCENEIFKSKLAKPKSKDISFLNELCDDFSAIVVSNESNSKKQVKDFKVAKVSNICRKDQNKSYIPDGRLLEFASELFEIRSLLQHNPVFPLYSDICKLLALLTITEPSYEERNSKEQGFLLSETFAITLRHHFVSSVMRKIRKGDQSFERKLPAAKESICDFSQEMDIVLNTLPENWTVIQISTVFEKEPSFDTGDRHLPKLILCQYRKKSLPLLVCVDHTQDENFTSSFFTEFEDILQQSISIMTNKNVEAWWKSRIVLNKRLKELSHSMENIWLGCWKGFLLGKPTCEDRIRELEEATAEILKIASTKNKDLLQILIDSANSLNREQVSEIVCHLWDCTPFDDMYPHLCAAISKVSSILSKSERHPVILILDKDIQALPWESMPMLKDVPVSRVPSISLLMSQLTSETFVNGADSSQTFYILNPSGDLLCSQERFENHFESKADWKGIVGRIPTPKEFVSAFEEHEIFLYCGHGSGRTYLEGTCVEKLQCKAAAVLMGCSSGRMKQLGRQLEPHGIAVRYWLSGCPCVVANLWDVTDKDIDKFTEQFLTKWVPNYKNNNSAVHDAAKATSMSRKYCKLQYLVGAAPVVYGLPVFTR